MNDNEGPPPSRNAAGHEHRDLPEWLQIEAEQYERAQALDRLWIAFGTMFLVVVAVVGANAALELAGYGA